MLLSPALVSKDETGLAPTAEIHSGHQSLYFENVAEVHLTVRASFCCRFLICLLHPPPKSQKRRQTFF